MLARLLCALPPLLGLSSCAIDWSEREPGGSGPQDENAPSAAGTGVDGGMGGRVDGGMGAGDGCRTGFTRTGARCVDVDECAADNGGCAHQCNNEDGSYSCQCDAGHTLATDGRGCVPFSWSAPTLLEVRDDAEAQDPRLVVDRWGHATVVWRMGSWGTIWANRYLPGKGWTGAVRIESGTGNALNPQAAVDAQGNVFVVWYSQLSGAQTVWANRFSPDTGWASPVQLDQEGKAHAYQQRVAVDAQGNATAVWIQGGEPRSHVAFARYVPGAGWGSPALAEDDADTSSLRHVALAVGPGDQAFAVWNRLTTPRSIWASRFVPGPGWEKAGPINISDEAVSEEPQVAASANGPVIAAWTQVHREKFSVWVRRHSEAGWETPLLLESDDLRDMSTPVVVSSDSGSAFVFFSPYQSPRDQQDRVPALWAARLADGRWEPALPIAPESTTSADRVAAAMDSSGHAVVAWSGSSDGTGRDLYVAHYSERSGFGAATLVEHDNFSDVDGPQVAMDASGHAFVVWLQSDKGRSSVWAARLEPCAEPDGDCSRPEPCTASDAGVACSCPKGFRAADDASAMCVDIDECAEGLDNCDTDPKACRNREGGFVCRCPTNYAGTGVGPEGCKSDVLDPWS